MGEISDDFSDAVTYLSKLFALKKLTYYDFNGYPMWYLGKKSFANGVETTSDQLPEESEIDTISAIMISVKFGKNEETVNLEFRGDRILYSDNSTEQKVKDFVFVLDRSMFRYF